MKKFFKNVIHNPLFSGSIIMMIGSNAANTMNYLYHLFIGRLLEPSSYGELASLISLSGLLSALPTSVGLVIVKYVSASKTEKDRDSLINWLKIKIFYFTIIYFILSVLFSPIIKSFLYISNLNYIIAITIVLLFSLPALYNRSILQGLLKFKESTVSILLENSMRLVVSVLLVYLGYQVGGAMVGLVVSVVFGWYISELYLKTYIKEKSQTPSNIKSMVLYSIPVIVQSVVLTSLYSADLILVKHFFSSYDAGIYASLSTLGKIILFGAGPISAVMFPLVSQRHSRNIEYRKIFNYSVLVTLAFALFILTIYWLYPYLAINLLYGPAYLEASNLLIWFGIFITLFTLSSLIINFHLSIGNVTVVLFPVFASIAQVLVIWFYHDSLFTIIKISIGVSALLLSLLLIYSSCGKKQSANKFSLSNSPNI